MNENAILAVGLLSADRQQAHLTSNINEKTNGQLTLDRATVRIVAVVKISDRVFLN